MTDFAGRIDSVYTRQFSAVVAAPAAAGAVTLNVSDADDLGDSGQIMTPWDSAVYDYTFDGDATVTLFAPLPAAVEEGELLIVWDPVKGAPVVDTVAHVTVIGIESSDDVVEARVSYSLIPLLPEGIRAEGEGESVTVRRDGTEYVVAEIVGQAAAMTEEFVDEVLTPMLPPGGGGDASDGEAPDMNPIVSVRPGIKSLYLTWDAITNADKVTYDVYAVPAADASRLAAPPQASDRVAETDATYAVIRALPDGTDLAHDASYAVAVYARDADGQATLSAATVTASPAQINSADLALDALTTNHLTANDALFEALKAQTIMGVEIEGGEFRTDAGANRIYIGKNPSGGQLSNGVIHFYSEDLDSPAIVQATSDGTLSITSGGDADLSNPDHPIQSASIGLIGVGPYSDYTRANLEAESVTVGGTGGSVIADGLTTVRGNSTVAIQAPTVDIDGTTLVDIDAPTIQLGRNAQGFPLLELFNNGTYRIRGTDLDRHPRRGLQGIGTNITGVDSGTWTKVTNWTNDDANFPVVSGLVISAANGGVQAQVAGLYLVTLTLSFTGGATGRIGAAIDVNSSGSAAYANRHHALVTSPTAAAGTIGFTQMVWANANDYIRAWAYQDSGADRTLSGNAASSSMKIVRVSA